MPNRDALAVLSFYALDEAAVRKIEPLASGGGWSGSRIWRVTDHAGREFCLRRWPTEHPTTDRLRLIHAVLSIVAVDLPIIAYPLPASSGSTFVEHAGHLWELTHWRPGTADYHSNPTRPRLRAALQTLARFHDLTARYQARHGIAPALLDRQWQWDQMKTTGLPTIERSLATPLAAELDRRAPRLLALAQNALAAPQIPAGLAAIPELLLQPAIRDIHHDHVLYSGDQVTGLIDFGALRIDTPLADVARLVGSLVADDPAARQFALDAYSELRPLSESDRRLIDLLDESGLVLSALNWLTWLYVERRDMGPREPIVRRLDEILGRLEIRAVGQAPCLP